MSHDMTPEQLNEYFKHVGPYKRKTILKRFDIEWTPGVCWYIIPTIELNFSVKEIAINILCLGIYFDFKR